MVTIVGKLAKAWFDEYTKQPAAHCDFLPLSKKYHAYGIGSVTLETEKEWERGEPEHMWGVEILQADSPI